MKYFLLLIIPVLIWSCSNQEQSTDHAKEISEFEFKADRFADIQILRYQVPGFEELDLAKKKLVYYLYQAALSGRDIIWDQNYRHNLRVRRTLEAIITSYPGDREEEGFIKFMTYAKRIWFSNGIHHHYSTWKIMPEFSSEYFHQLVHETDSDLFPLLEGETKHELVEKLIPAMFDPNLDAKRVNLSDDVDNIAESANNYYGEVTKQEVEDYYKSLVDQANPQKVSYGLNSKMVKENGEVIEKHYKIGGLYSAALQKMVSWLEKAVNVAENDQQRTALEKLIKYYQTGDLKVFDEYNIAWVQDINSQVDIINGFIEVYGDPLGYRGAYESVLSIKDQEASARMAALAENAQWFEDNSPIMDIHKKKEVKGVSYKVITVVVEAGDAAPSTPIGINLPNSSWIRKEHGSKSVSLGNIKDAYNNASGKGALEEFAHSDEVKQRADQYGILAGNMHTALHEVIGHASGQLEPGVPTPNETLKNYRSALEEARADLVSLFYIIDPKLVEIGVVPSIDVGKTEYDIYILNGLMLQLRRLNDGENIEQAHMRNRQTVAKWVYEKGQGENVVEKISKDGKTYFVINDYDKLRSLFGELLKEVQRIISTGDFEAGKQLIETYGVQVDQDLLKETKERYSKLDYAPYSGFIQPKLIAQMEGEEIVEVKIEYPDNFVNQMLEYGREYSFLPNNN